MSGVDTEPMSGSPGSPQGRGPSDAELVALIERLDGEDHEAAEEAEFELKLHGDRTLELLLGRALSFGRFGKLCAIELFDHLDDPRAAAVLIPMLRDEDETVRGWAAASLGALQASGATDALLAAYEALKVRGLPLDWSEAESIRGALTALKVRTEVIPPQVAARARHVDPIGQAWPIDDLVEVIEALTSAQQRILGIAVFTRNAGAYGWRVDTDVDWPGLDVSLPWSQLVADAREAALDVATHPRVPRDAYATLSWIDRSDT